MPHVLRSIKRLGLVLATAAAFPALAAPASADLPLQPLLAGEFALQAGKLDEAARSYLQAARATRDVALAERATGIALVGKDDKRAAEALKLWRDLLGPAAAGEADIAVAEATLALHRGDESAATRQLAALFARPDDGWKLAIGTLAGGAKTPKQAAAIVTRLLDDKAVPPTLQAWLALGGLAQRLDQPKLADRIVAEVIAKFPGDSRVALLKASQLREAGKKAEARAVVDALRDPASKDAELRLLVAREYDALGEPAAAADMLARGPQDDQTYAMRASLYARGDDRAKLQQLYDELARDAQRPEPDRRLLLGQLAEYLKHFDAALGWYTSVPGGPQRWIARLRTANVLHELGRGKEAVDALRALQQDAAADDDVRRDAYSLEAALWQKDKDDAREMDAFARGLAAMPDDPDLLYARALSWERRDDVARAEAHLRRILVAQPDNVATLNALGYTLADRTTRFQEALELINRARAAEPNNAAIVDSYGWVLYRLGKPAEALVELQRAYALQKDAEIAAHVGEVLWVLGRQDEARRYFTESRKLDAENRSLARALKTTGAVLPPEPASPTTDAAPQGTPVPAPAGTAPGTSTSTPAAPAPGAAPAAAQGFEGGSATGSVAYSAPVAAAPVAAATTKHRPAIGTAAIEVRP
jgi:tetratricopeptide (TPR) repeat protein